MPLIGQAEEVQVRTYVRVDDGERVAVTGIYLVQTQAIVLRTLDKRVMPVVTNVHEQRDV